jgi:DNA-binding GntR family transcriptional regulator
MAQNTLPDQTSKLKIYKELRRAIIMGHSRPGQRLEVEEVAHRYSTSVTPVRDALQMLNQEGLVVIRPRSGYFITSLTLKQLRDMLELRKILEVAGVERAAQRVTPEQIQQLRAVHSGYTGDDDESYERYTDENSRFHRLLAEASGNLKLAESVGHLMDRLARFMVLRHAGQTLEQRHMRVVDALAAHDAEAARRALLDDIDNARDAILDEVIEGEADTWHVQGGPPSG